MEVTQFTYFQQVGGFDCKPVAGELTYGLERLAMYIQGVDNVFDLEFNGGRQGAYLRRRLPSERAANTRATISSSPTPTMLLQHFRDAETECRALLAMGRAPSVANGAAGLRSGIKATHIFNLLDARGVISRDRAAELHRPRAGSGKGARCAAWLERPKAGRTGLKAWPHG